MIEPIMVVKLLKQIPILQHPICTCWLLAQKTHLRFQHIQQSQWASDEGIELVVMSMATLAIKANEAVCVRFSIIGP